MEKIYGRKIRVVGEMEVYLSHTMRSDCVGCDSSAWERGDLWGIAEEARFKTNEKEIVFIHKIADLWNSMMNNVVITNNSTWVTRENGQVLRRKTHRRKTHCRPLNGQTTWGSRNSPNWKSPEVGKSVDSIIYTCSLPAFLWLST